MPEETPSASINRELAAKISAAYVRRNRIGSDQDRGDHERREADPSADRAINMIGFKQRRYGAQGATGERKTERRQGVRS